MGLLDERLFLLCVYLGVGGVGSLVGFCPLGVLCVGASSLPLFGRAGIF